MSKLSVWNIKNRWLRAAVSSVIFPPLLVGLLVFTVALAAVDAVWWAVKEMVKQFAFTFRAAEWSDLLALSWRAMTAKEAV